MNDHNSRIWLEKSVALNELKPFERNPRRITDVQYGKLLASLTKHGYHSRIKCTKDYRVIGGHQRIKALKELGYEVVQVLVPDFDLPDDDFRQLILTDNISNGVFDMDILSADYTLEECRALGMHEVMNLPDDVFGQEEETESKGKTMVCCPQCKKVFPVKGNKADGILR